MQLTHHESAPMWHSVKRRVGYGNEPTVAKKAKGIVSGSSDVQMAEKEGVEQSGIDLSALRLSN